MSSTTITNLSDNTFILHKHVLEANSSLVLDDSEISGTTADWEVLRPLNHLASAGDVTTSGAVSLPNWGDFPGGVSDMSATEALGFTPRSPKFFR